MSRTPSRARAHFVVQLLVLVGLLAGTLPLHALPAAAQQAFADLAEPNGNEILRPTAYGDRTGNTVTEPGYAAGLAGVVFEARRDGTTVARCTTGGDGRCDLRVRRQNGRNLTVVQVAAPVGWEPLEQIAYGGDYRGVGNQAPAYTSRAVQIPNTSGAVTTLAGSGGSTTGYDWNSASSPNGRWSGFLNRRVNPALTDDVCTGIDIAVLLDVSGSVDLTGNLVNFRNGVTGLADALKDTPHRLSTFRFGNIGQRVGTDGAPGNAGATWLSMSDPTEWAQARARLANSYSTGPGGHYPNSAQGTNYDQGFSVVRQHLGAAPADLVLFVTDGNPTLVATANQGSNASSTQRDVTYGGAAANALKATGSRVVTIGAGSFGNSIANLQMVSGTGADHDYYAGDFSQIGTLLQRFIGDLCGGTVTVQKKLEAADGTRTPAAGWGFDVTGPDAPTARWTTAGANGNFAVDFGRAGQVTIVEDLASQPGFEAVEQTCTRGDQPIATTPVDGAVGVGFHLDDDEAVNCVFVNREIPEPSIAITKTTREPVVLSGAPATWDLTLRNDGNVPLRDVTFTDVLGDDAFDACETAATAALLAAHPSGVLPAGATVEFSCDLGSVTAPVTNVMTVAGTPTVGDDTPVTATDEDDVTTLVADISVTKVAAPDQVLVGRSTTWTVTVANDGTADLGDLTFEDEVEPACELAAEAALASLGTAGILPAGEAITFTCDTDDLQVDTTNRFVATGTATVPGPDATVTDADTATVTVWSGDIEVVKEARDPVVLTGGTATWDISVTNTGRMSLVDLAFEDVVEPGCVAAAVAAFEDAYPSGILPPDGQVGFSCTTTGIAGPTTNTFAASGIPLLIGGEDDRVTDEDDATVMTVAPELTVTKGVDRPVVIAGATVTWSVEVVNTGTVDLVDLDITDEVAPACADALATALAATPHEGVLRVGERVEADCSTQVTEDTVNTVIVSGAPDVDGDGQADGPPVTEQDDAQVAVLEGDIVVTKDVDRTSILAGQDVTWSITVANAGTADLGDLTFVDLVEPACVAAAESAYLAAFTDGVLTPGDGFAFDCVTTGLTEDTTNVFEASGTPTLGDADDTVTAEDDARVTVQDGSLAVTKAAHRSVVLTGQDVTWSITVTNDGSATLADLTFVDVAEGSCVAAADEAYLDAFPAGVLLPGDTFGFDCVTSAVTEDTTNVFETSAVPTLGGEDDTVTAEDDASVTVVAASIAVTKDVAADLVLAGSDVTWTITVTNEGTALLADLDFDDAVEPACVDAAEAAYAEQYGSGAFFTGAVLTFDCTTSGLTAPTTNVFVASGVPTLGDEGDRVSADDEAGVTPARFRVALDGDATNLVGDPHTFTATVTVSTGGGFTPVPDGTTLEVLFAAADGEVGAIATDDCATDGTTGGSCTVVVDTTVTGTGTLQVVGIDRVQLREDVTFTDVTVAGHADAITGDDAAKTWVAYDATLSPDAVNPMGEPHTFVVTVTRDAGSGAHAIVGATASTVWSGDEEVRTCVTGDDGTCEVAVPAPASAGSGTLRVTTVDHDGFSVDLTADPEATVGRPADAVQPAATKTWVAHRATLSDDAINLTGDDHDFTVTVQRTVDGEVWTDAVDGTLPVVVVTSGDGAIDPASSCLTDGTTDGTCTITVVDSGPGATTVAVTAITTTVTGAPGDELFADGEPFLVLIDEDQVDDATKTWVEVDAAITPPEAINRVGDDHRFSVVATVADGEAGTELASMEMCLLWDGDGAAPADVGADLCTWRAVDVDGSTGSTEVTVASPITGGAGTLTLEAVRITVDRGEVSESFTISGASGTAADLTFPVAADKDWIDYELTVTPDRDVNLLPGHEDHTFTVTLGSTDTGIAPVAGQVVDLTFDSTVARIVELHDGDGEATYGADDPAPTSCTTEQGGRCTVVVRADGPGAGSLTAGFETVIGDAVFAAGDVTATGDKTWTTYVVRITGSPAQNLLGTPHVFGVEVLQTSDGETFTPVQAAPDELDVTISGDAFVVATGAAADCANGTGASGGCNVTVDSEVTGVFTLAVTYTGRNESVTGTQTAAFSAEGSKRWIDYRVTVDPATAANLTGTDHTFTVTVSTDLGDGAGFVPVPGAVPTVALAGVGTITGDGCAEGTAADGTCAVTITSATTGTSVLEATYLGSTGVGGQYVGPIETGEYGATGSKTWVDYRVEVDPDRAINALDDPHTFTVTLSRDEGAGHVPVAGETVRLAIDGPGSITAVVEGTIDGGASCTTDEAGRCQVTIVSSTPGTTTLTASYDAVVEETSATFTDQGVKHWAAIGLVKEARVTPDADGTKVVDLLDGDEVTYDYTVTNLGPVPLTVTSLEDDVIGTVDLPDALTLAPGESRVVTAPYTVTAVDLAAGEVVNVAVVAGEAEDGTEVTAVDDERIVVVETEVLGGNPDVQVDKRVIGLPTGDDGRPVADVADRGTVTLVYGYTVTNTGNEPLVDLSIVDDRIGDLTTQLRAAVVAAYGEPILPVGGRVRIEATDTTSAADLAAGEVVNVATVDGTGGDSGLPARDVDDAVVVLRGPRVPTEVAGETIRRLPFTGSDTRALLLYALLITAIGTAALLFTSRRRADGAR